MLLGQGPALTICSDIAQVGTVLISYNQSSVKKGHHKINVEKELTITSRHRGIEVFTVACKKEAWYASCEVKMNALKVAV